MPQRRMGVRDPLLGGAGKPTQYDGEIVVPFSPESLLSGVGRQLLPGQTLWYRRAARFKGAAGRRILLHFGAVDQCCTVYLNGKGSRVARGRLLALLLGHYG